MQDLLQQLPRSRHSTRSGAGAVPITYRRAVQTAPRAPALNTRSPQSTQTIAAMPKPASHTLASARPERGSPCTARAGQQKQQIQPVAAGPQLCYLYMGRRARCGRTTCHCESATAWPATASSVASSSGISARSSQTCAHPRPGYISPLGSPDAAAVRGTAAASRAEPRRQRVSMHGVPACAQRRQRALAQRTRGCARRRQRSRPGPSARMRSGRAAVRASLPIGPSMRGPHGPRQLAVRRPLRTSSLVNPIIRVEGPA